MTTNAENTPPADVMPTPAVGSLPGLPVDGVPNPIPDETAIQTLPPFLFKKRKVLPHPKKDSYASLRHPHSRLPAKYDLIINTALARNSGSQPSSPYALKHQLERLGPSLGLPPTPPAHSRNSSSTYSVLPSSPTYVQSPERSDEDVRSTQLPVTPTRQIKPPTPDFTPPDAPSERRPNPKIMRPMVSDRMPSKMTTDSRTESFKTAPENQPSPNENEDGRSTLRPILPSPKTSQSTIREAPRETRKKKPQAIGLGLGLESSTGDSLTPKSKREFITFDGDWGSEGEVEQEWDDNLDRTVVVKKRRPPPRLEDGRRDEVVEDVTISPTNATKALRTMALPHRILTFPLPKESLQERQANYAVAAEAMPMSDSSSSIDTRRFSTMSSKSTVSTVVEAILVDAPPSRQRTLRHIKKHAALRNSGSDLSPSSSAPTSLLLDEAGSQKKLNGTSGRYHDIRHQSYASNGTMNSISSRRARREVWKNGGIPVVIVPDRQSSVKSNTSKEPSLRSTSSRKSKVGQTVTSVPLSQIPKSKDLAPYFERPSRRGRAMSESDGSTPGDQRTMDYPPIVPRRTSSLSAPTSRNVSRTHSRNPSQNPSRDQSRSGSLTAESLQAHNLIQAQMEIKAQKEMTNGQQQRPEQPEQPLPELKLQRAATIEPHKATSGGNLEQEDHGLDFDHDHFDEHRLSVDRHGDPFFGKRLSTHNTPFSQASVETGTSHHSHMEISEALAVSIYPHQNTSVLVVDHSNRPSDSSDGSQTQPERSLEKIEQPEAEVQPLQKLSAIKTTDHDATGPVTGPVTPPQPQFTLDDVDSPLRNPRAPPEPPAIKFIPATPSGLTPAVERERQRGNYFEHETNEKPRRSASLLRRALSNRRRHSYYGESTGRSHGLLMRTFSLTHGARKEAADVSKGKGKGPAPEMEPAEENKLHPFWRPASSYHSDGEDVEDDEDDFVRDAEEETYRYPPIDNRPRPPRRSLSARMKRTFAILPIQDRDDDYYDYYPATSHYGPDRRTVRRTASGNLRVVKHRASLDSLRQRAYEDGHPFTTEDGQPRRRVHWRTPSPDGDSRDGGSRERGEGRWGRIRFPSFGGRIGEYGLHTIPRRLSERRREKRSRELRQKISGPREVRDGVGDVIRRNSYRDAFTQAQPL